MVNNVFISGTDLHEKHAMSLVAIEDLIQQGCTCYVRKTGQTIPSIVNSYFAGEPYTRGWGEPDEDHDDRGIKYRLENVEFSICEVIATHKKAYGTSGPRTLVERLPGRQADFPTPTWANGQTPPQPQEMRASELEKQLAQARQEVTQLTQEIERLNAGATTEHRTAAQRRSSGRPPAPAKAQTPRRSGPWMPRSPHQRTGSASSGGSSGLFSRFVLPHHPDPFGSRTLTGIAQVARYVCAGEIRARCEMFIAKRLALQCQKISSQQKYFIFYLGTGHTLGIFS